MKPYTPTKAQTDKIEELKKQGYKWDRLLSLASAMVIFIKEGDIWAFGLDESIQHNPEGVPVYVKSF